MVETLSRLKQWQEAGRPPQMPQTEGQGGAKIAYLICPLGGTAGDVRHVVSGFFPAVWLSLLAQ